MAVVEVLTTGRTRDTILATCARNLSLIAAVFNIDFIFSHIPDIENTVADLFHVEKMIYKKLKFVMKSSMGLKFLFNLIF